MSPNIVFENKDIGFMVFDSVCNKKVDSMEVAIYGMYVQDAPK